MIIRLMSSITLVYILFHSPFSFACDHMKAEDCLHKSLEKMNVTKDQKVKLKLLTHKAKMEIIVRHHELHTIRTHIDEAFTSGNINEGKIDKFANQKARVMRSIARTRLYERYKIYRILNAHQKEEMNTLMKACMQQPAS